MHSVWYVDQYPSGTSIRPIKLQFNRGKPFSVCLSARKVTFNIRARKCDPRHVGEFEWLQNYSNFEHFGFLCRNNNKSWKFAMEKKTLAYRRSTAKILFRVHTLCLRVCLQFAWKTRLLLVIQEYSGAKIPMFSKSLLNLAQFDGKLIGICKNLLLVSWRLRTLRFSY